MAAMALRIPMPDTLQNPKMTPRIDANSKLSAVAAKVIPRPFMRAGKLLTKSCQKD